MGEQKLEVNASGALCVIADIHPSRWHKDINPKCAKKLFVSTHQAFLHPAIKSFMPKKFKTVRRIEKNEIGYYESTAENHILIFLRR